MIGLPTADDVLAFWFGNAPLHAPRPNLATIMVRFLMFLTMAIGVLLLAWAG